MISRPPHPHAPTVIVFDVNETLSDLSPIRAQFARHGAPAELATAWFASVLRDGFALTVTGTKPSFARLATDAARTVLAPYTADADRAADDVLRTFGELQVHPDVAEGVHDLHTLGMRMVTLSNGATTVAQGLLRRAGLDGWMERLLSVDDAPAWKPAAEAYRYAAAQCGVGVGECMLVASHPWDLHGAHRAGMATAWVNRADVAYPSSFDEPDLEVESLVDLAAQLGGAGA